MAEKTEKLLEEIKILLILQLFKSGVKPEEIGKVLGVGGSRIKNIIYGVGKKNDKRKD